MFTHEIIRGGAESVDTIVSEWRSLCDEGACCDPFLRPEWFSALSRTFGIGLILLTIRRDGRLRAVLPLANGRANVHGLSVRSLHSAYDLNTPRYGMIHGADASEYEQIAAEIWKAIGQSRNWDVFEARMAMRDGRLADVTHLAKNAGEPTGVWEMDPAPYIALDDGNDRPIAAEDYFTGHRRHFGRELDRRLRRLGELGDVAFRIDIEYSHDAVQRYLDLETLGWKGHGGTAAIQDDRAARLHHDFAEQMSIAGKLRIYELTLDGQPIAMSLNIVDGERLFHWKTTYDEAYAKFSPGNLLFRRLFSDSIAQGLIEIDLMSPATVNKRVWATGEREHAAFYVFRRSLVGRLSWAWKFIVISRLRRFRRK